MSRSDEELNLFTNIVDLAVSRANNGDAVAGYEELLVGLQRAEAAKDDGEAEGEEWVGRWRRAVERFGKLYQVGRA